MGKSNSGIKPLHKLTLGVAVATVLLGIYSGLYFANRGSTTFYYVDDTSIEDGLLVRETPKYHMLQKPSEVVFLPLEALGFGQLPGSSDPDGVMRVEVEWLSPWLLEFISRKHWDHYYGLI